MSSPWPGSGVADRLGTRLQDEPASSLGLPVTELVGLAVRRNPLRAHLLVSTVLGKHIPVDPLLVLGSGWLLGAAVRQRLTPDGTGGCAHGVRLLRAALRGDAAAVAGLAALNRPPAAGLPVVVIGYAETATGLGHCVADALAAPYLHSTRRAARRGTGVRFEEEHSHATGHVVVPDDLRRLTGDHAVVLVDDELSTGQTVVNTITALLRLAPGRRHYVVATLVDLRSATDRERLAEFARTRGVTIDVVALAAGRLELPPDVLGRGRVLAASYDLPAPPPVPANGLPVPAQASPVPVVIGWPVGVREGGRHGFDPADSAPLAAAAQVCAAGLAAHVGSAARVLVLGTEELMYAPLRIAASLRELLPAATVMFSTTTRSPIVAVDDPGYAVRTQLSFPAHDDPPEGPGLRYAYNVAPGADPGRRFDAIVLVVDGPADTAALHAPGGLLATLAAVTDRVLPVRIPARQLPVLGSPAVGATHPEPLTGPAFGSYDKGDVGWLLTDLSGAAIEAPIEEREEAIQAGAAHYAESLPIEYEPDAEYHGLFARALDHSAARVARAVGVVTEQVLAARGSDAVLVSLARAGTPVGVLMRRWAATRGVELPHYAVSIVRGRGIDVVALRWLAARHDPRNVVFVDGWTGKGAITRELAQSVAVANDELGLAPGFSPEVVVLADTGSCVRTFGTRADFLIPSACLNSTVSGLVSRTVLNGTLIGPGQFHGAKFYAELGHADVSNVFIDRIVGRFAEQADAVAAHVAALKRGLVATEPTWSGWAAVEQLSARYGIHDVNLVKPGVGETTRVLLRRVPWRVVMRRDAQAELAHVMLLAEQRGVTVELVDELAYSCVGLIHPRFTRGATGSAGTRAAG